jgi:hypothetical protein
MDAGKSAGAPGARKQVKMGKRTGKAGKPHRDERARRPFVRSRWRAAASFLAGTTLLAGCSTSNNVTTADPLLGPGASRPLAQAPAAAAAPAATAAATPLPRQAAPASLTSNAALANGVPNVPDNGQDLRIAGSYQRTDAPAAPQGGVMLQQPQPTFTPTSAQVPHSATAPAPAASTAPAPAPISNAPGSTFEQGLAALGTHHVTWQRLETVDTGGWKFSCSVPNPQNASVSRTYTATAADPVSALKAVLSQLDRGQ